MNDPMDYLIPTEVVCISCKEKGVTEWVHIGVNMLPDGPKKYLGTFCLKCAETFGYKREKKKKHDPL